jgi:hypothetical protein
MDDGLEFAQSFAENGDITSAHDSLASAGPLLPTDALKAMALDLQQVSDQSQLCEGIEALRGALILHRS